MRSMIVDDHHAGGPVVSLRTRQRAEVVQGMAGTSAAIERLREDIRRVAASDRPVLILGPTGAGKEVAARAVHALGISAEAPLIDINCGALAGADSLMESQLFGHERGAFAGADRGHDGLFAAVKQGTLFLDEIGELPLPLQGKLLRVLETGRFRRVGGVDEMPFVGRIVASTRSDLQTRVGAGRFRDDLWYRLGVLVVRVPSLEERREDIPALVSHFVQAHGRPLRFTEEALQTLMGARWPGNVRQLRNLIDRIAVLAREDLVGLETLAMIEDQGRSDAAAMSLASLVDAILEMPMTGKLEAVERAMIRGAVTKAGGNKSETARLLGVHRKVIERRLASLGRGV
jgi:DNA-binding NtrC family response regulator